MNIVSVSAASLIIHAAHLIIIMYALRTLAAKYHDKPWAQGLAALIF